MSDKTRADLWRRGVTALGAMLACLAAATPAKASRPNLIILMADDLGYSDIAPFGAEIATPNLTQLAAEGCLLTNLHATPAGITRAELLSGADHHRVGMSAMYAAAGRQIGRQAYQRFIADDALSIAELLSDGGYHTYLAGRWGLGTSVEHGPRARGFEESFSVVQAANDQLEPSRIDPKERAAGPAYRENDVPAQIPAAAYASDFLTDKLISYIESHRTDGRPFLAYLGFTVPHFPLQAPDGVRARYAGRYDAGYDAIRAQRIARQELLGVIPRDFRPSPPKPAAAGREFWQQLSPTARQVEARRMEIYAAMIDNMDANIGRLLRYLRERGLYENSFIVFLSGNGAATAFPLHRSIDYVDNRLQNMGRRNSFIFYSARWAEVSDAPFSRWKGKGNEGAISVPGIVRLPQPLARHCILSPYLQVRDLAPTLLELAGVPNPGAQYRDHAVVPMSGHSALSLFLGKATGVHAADEVFAGETSGEAYVRRGRWKAVLETPFEINFNETADSEGVARLTLAHTPPLGWRLYDIERDRGETTDLAARYQAPLRALIDAYDRYAERVGVVAP
ncbi:MAG TPA: sulfatase-like hydrolase/transferase [Steroidobacteraceae bacterium]|nr:sulfatase-like hydrolase/transferase [Steroidobacteraceae bacterium]